MVGISPSDVFWSSLHFSRFKNIDEGIRWKHFFNAKEERMLANILIAIFMRIISHCWYCVSRLHESKYFLFSAHGKHKSKCVRMRVKISSILFDLQLCQIEHLIAPATTFNLWPTFMTGTAQKPTKVKDRNGFRQLFLAFIWWIRDHFWITDKCHLSPDFQ